MELAKALDEAVWMVSGDAVSSVAADVPSPAAKGSGQRGASGRGVRRSCASETPAETARAGSFGSRQCSAGRTCAPGGRSANVIGEDSELFHDRTGNGRALRILLRLVDRSWCAVQGTLVEPLPQDVLETLSVGQADRHALHRLLGECLDKPVAWSGLSDEEALLLLRDLYGATPEERERWRTMPLHRSVDGIRGAFDKRARRSTGRTDELQLPTELEAEVRLLDPETCVAHLYDSVPEMDHDGLLRLMLEDARPWRFADKILHGIRTSEGSVLLPQDRELRDLLRRSRWLPRRDGGALAPDAVLVAPKELLHAVAGLASAGAFGEKQLPEAVDSRVWKTAEPVVRELLGRPSRERQVQRMVDALESDRVDQVNRGAWLVMPKPDLVDASLVEDALQTTLAGSHPGWKLVHTADRVVGHGGGRTQDSSEPLVKLAKALCAPISSDRQIEMLRSLGESRPARDSSSGRMFSRLLDCFADTNGFFVYVLPKLRLPTQDGHWRPSLDVARTETGVARRHRLIPELRPILRLGSDDPVTSTSRPGSTWNGTGLDALENYFEPWRGRVPRGAVGAFLSLLGSGLDGVIARLAEQWLGEDVVIEPIEGFDQSAVSVFVSPKVAQGDRVSAVNVLGSRVEMEAEADEDTLLAIDPLRYETLPPSSVLAPLGAFWQVELRDVEPQSRPSSDLLRLLGGTALVIG